MLTTENNLRSIECRDCQTFFNTFDPLQVICEDCIDVRMDQYHAERFFQAEEIY